MSKYSVTGLGTSFSFEISKKTYDLIKALREKTNPLTGFAQSAKTLSREYGYGEKNAEIKTEDMFSPLAYLHPQFDPKRSMAEQTVDLQRLVVYSLTCACLAQTCTQGNGAGCPIDRDINALKTFGKAASINELEIDGQKKYTLELQLVSTPERPDSVALASTQFFKNSPFNNGPYCGANAKCKFACTYSNSATPNLEDIAKALEEEKDPEGVLVPIFENLLFQLKSAIKIEGKTIREKNFENKEVTQPERVALIGGGPSGKKVACILKDAGLEVHLYDHQKYVGGSVNDFIPTDKNDLDTSIEDTRLLENKGIILHMEHKISEVLYNGEKNDGITLIRPETIMQNYDVVVLATGAYNKHMARGLGNIYGEKNENGKNAKNILSLADWLKPVNRFISGLNIAHKKALETALTGEPGLNKAEFSAAFIEEYYNNEKTAFKLKVGDKLYNYDDLNNKEYIVAGVGYSGHDTVRTLMEFLSKGDPKNIKAKITWVARRMQGDDDKAWPECHSNNEKEPTVKMLRLAQKKGVDISDEYLKQISEIIRDGNGNITSIKYEVREIKNPHIASVSLGKAEYRRAKDEIEDFTNGRKEPFIITATGYEAQKHHPLLQAFGAGSNYETIGAASDNHHIAFNVNHECAVFAAGNIASTGASTRPDEVVEADASGTIAAAHVLKFIERSRNKNVSEKADIFDMNKSELINPASLFSKNTKSLNNKPTISLVDLLLNGHQNAK